LTINGGTLVVNASGDGLDSNGSIEMNDGTVVVNGPTDSMNGTLDYDSTFNMNGGTLIGVGSSGMAMSPSSTSSTKLPVHIFNPIGCG
jgi:formylmethanofuran dehydrogenase subunit C